MNERQPTTEYVERFNPVDTIRSTHSELLKSVEYGHEDQEGYIYTDIALRSIHTYWTAEKENPIRSDRSKEACNLIARKALFEIAYRNHSLESLERLYERGTVDA